MVKFVEETVAFNFLKKPPLLSIESIRDSAWDVQDYRNKSKICIIDDSDFGKKNGIENHGYNVQELGDISSIEQCANFDIIVCDIRGVGAAFESNLEGAYIIKEVRSRFPEKYIIMYSASSFSARFQPYLKVADSHLRKIDDISDWVDSLDEGAKQLLHPYCRWVRTRDILLHSGIEISKVSRLESEYVNAIKTSDPEIIKRAFQDDQIDNLKLAGLGVGIAQFIATIAIS
ncbi:response regulator [Amylibacter sp. IMCC11727]|uniref:response regulator n=1 Tax=Amylibacter sp. IMCC11727 TaxID=3039851 RepID=UPI00244D9B41|nr:response regulator [Amylibacter sp. IMCC11727]WGI20793.1 response regulator [Amylibacter sp. IMCC11727]